MSSCRGSSRGGPAPGRAAARRISSVPPAPATIPTASPATAHRARPSPARRPRHPHPRPPCRLCIGLTLAEQPRPAPSARRPSAAPDASGCRRPPRSGAGSERTHGVPSPATNSWSCRSIATSPPGAESVCGQPPTPVSPHTTVIRTGGYRPSSHASDTRSVPVYVGCSSCHSRANVRLAGTHTPPSGPCHPTTTIARSGMSRPGPRCGAVARPRRIHPADRRAATGQPPPTVPEHRHRPASHRAAPTCSAAVTPSHLVPPLSISPSPPPLTRPATPAWAPAPAPSATGPAAAARRTAAEPGPVRLRPPRPVPPTTSRCHGPCPAGRPAPWRSAAPAPASASVRGRRSRLRRLPRCREDAGVSVAGGLAHHAQLLQEGAQLGGFFGAVPIAVQVRVLRHVGRRVDPDGLGPGLDRKDPVDPPGRYVVRQPGDVDLPGVGQIGLGRFVTGALALGPEQLLEFSVLFVRVVQRGGLPALRRGHEHARRPARRRVRRTPHHQSRASSPTPRSEPPVHEDRPHPYLSWPRSSPFGLHPSQPCPHSSQPCPHPHPSRPHFRLRTSEPPTNHQPIPVRPAREPPVTSGTPPGPPGFPLRSHYSNYSRCSSDCAISTARPFDATPSSRSVSPRPEPHRPHGSTAASARRSAPRACNGARPRPPARSSAGAGAGTTAPWSCTPSGRDGPAQRRATPAARAPSW